VPGLATAAESAHTLTDALAAAVAGRAGGPGFNTVIGGMSRLVDALAVHLPDVRLGAAVRELHPASTGWRLVAGATRDSSTVDCDAVVLAVPAAPAARLLSTVDGAPPVPLDYASVALVALAFEHITLPELSGFLVPPGEGFGVKAATFFGRKWAHQRRDDGVSVVRASLGRAGEAAVLQQRDEDLVAQVRLELAKLIGVDALPAPVDAGVFRWGGGLPQYTPDHRLRVERLRHGLAGRAPIAVAGAAYDGVGIPACVRSGRTAADAVLDSLGGWGT
jgi:oxygen-dependent protoporphyrinogen oxidase